MSRTSASEPIWARPEPGSRRPRFSREQIASVALRIADAEGFEAVSMRRIAAELHAGTMSLYHYVRTKDELVALMDDAIMAETLIPDQELPAGWREALAAIARSTRATLGRHPWALHSLQDASPGPNAMRHFEQSLAAVEGTPLDTRGKFALLAIVDDYVFGHALRAREVRSRAGTSAADADAAREFAMAQLRTGRYPRTEALVSQWEEAAEGAIASEQMSEQGFEEVFEQGLQMLLDGAAARLRLPSQPSSTRRPIPG